MTKKQALELWMEGDGAAIADALGISKQVVSRWKNTPGATTTMEKEILAFCAVRFRGRRLVKRLVPIEAEKAVC